MFDRIGAKIQDSNPVPEEYTAVLTSDCERGQSTKQFSTFDDARGARSLGVG